jgi:hypothetical protein
MSRSLQQVVELLRRAGLSEAAADAQRTLPDPVDQAEIDRFATAHGLSIETLMNNMGGSP